MPEAQQMLDQIVYAAVFVTDQERALDFYTNVLGLEQRVDNPTPDGLRFLTVGVRGQDFQLVLWPGTPGKAQPTQGRILHPPCSRSSIGAASPECPGLGAQSNGARPTIRHRGS